MRRDSPKRWFINCDQGPVLRSQAREQPRSKKHVYEHHVVNPILDTPLGTKLCPTSVLCCCFWLVLIICGTLVFCTVRFTTEIYDVRNGIQPMVNAMVPVIRDSSQITLLATNVTERVLRMASSASNATEFLPPLASMMFNVINTSNAMMQHVEKLTQHPTIKLDLGG